MAKIWKAVGIIVCIAIVFGVLCCLVGYITGGSTDRVQDIFCESYGVGSVREYVEAAVHDALGIIPYDVGQLFK